MKILLIYTGPKKRFTKEDLKLAKIQIDNSLDLGWKKEDIFFVTDFDFEYNGVKSFVIEGDIFYPFDLKANKIPVIVFLLKKGLIEQDELFWCHDLDAYENYRIKERELGLEQFDLGLTHYFYKPEWQCGSFFFKSGAYDIFELVDETTRKRPHNSRNNEKTLTWLIKHNAIDEKRYKKLNTTYNLMKRSLDVTFGAAFKPLRVLHFRPGDKDRLMPDTALNMFMYGKNILKMPLMSKRLIKIFKYHGVN